MINKTIKIFSSVFLISIILLSSVIAVHADGTSDKGTSTVTYSVSEIGEPLTYELQTDDIDFGTLEQGYGEIEFREIIVRSVGTGDLTNVCVYYDSRVLSFLRIQHNNTFIDLPAGTVSDGEWFVMPETGLAPGYYSAYINVSSSETESPLSFKISFTVTGSTAESTDISDTEDSSETESEIKVTAVPQTSISVRILPSSRPGKTEAQSESGKTLNSILFFLIFALLTALIVIVVFKIVKIKKEKEKNDKK